MNKKAILHRGTHWLLAALPLAPLAARAADSLEQDFAGHTASGATLYAVVWLSVSVSQAGTRSLAHMVKT